MSRLLFAAARGARLEYRCLDIGTPFAVTRIRPTKAETDDSELDLWWRIHPDDERLQYGPISTALRKSAKDTSGAELLAVNHYWGLSSVGYDDWCLYREYASELHRSLFLLILSEALADEGL